jgi:hypothetical protein
MRAHKQDMYAAWARDWGIDGYEQWDPKNREKARQKAAKYRQKRNERKEDNQTVTYR